MSHPRSILRASQAGAIAISMGVAVMLLVALALAALLFVGEARHPQPKREDRTSYPKGTDQEMPENGYRLVWRAREDGTGAPTLALFLRPTDVVETVSYRTASQRSFESEYQTMVRVLAPSADSLKADPASGPAPCAASEKPFAGCASTGVGRMYLRRGDSATDIYAALEELRLPRLHPDPAFRPKEPSRQDLRIFRTQADAQTRHVAIRSWTCVQGARDLLVPAPAGACDPPGKANADLSAVLFQCGSITCSAQFLFHKRLARLEFEFLPEPGAAQMRMRLFLTAWEMLNRQHMDAHRPLDLEFERADTAVQLESCRSIAQEASRWVEGISFRSSSVFNLWHNVVGRSCQHVEKTALRLAKTEPDRAAPVLGQLIAIHQQARLRIGKPVYDAHFALLEQRNGGETVEMLDAAVSYLEHESFEGSQGRDAMVPRALALAGKLQLPMTDPRVLLLRERTASGLRYKNELAQLTLFHEETIAGIVKEKGPLDAALLPHLVHLGHVVAETWESPAMKRTADQLARVWLAQPAPDPSVGFDLVFFYKVHAFRMKQFDAVLPAMRKVIERMESGSGTDDRYVKAARYHLSEVVERKHKGSTIGGGFL